jgi:hypothetical protein
LTAAPLEGIPTVVVVSSSKTCEDGEHKGIVFFDSEPAAWYCLADDEVDKFKTWAASTFPSARIVTATEPTLTVSCPPPPAEATDSDQMREAICNELRDLAPQWFVQAKARQVA